MKLICCFVTFVVVSSGPCLAQTTARAMTNEEIRQRVADANAKEKRLIVILKTGESVSGAVLPESGSSFRLTHSHGLFGDGQSVVIDYADVAAIKARNPLVKALKNFGSVSVLAVGVAAFTPVRLALQGWSYLVHGEGLPSCSTGN